MNFDYIIHKIKNAEWKSEPFPHLLIENFFTEADFDLIRSDPQIKIANSLDDREVIRKIMDSGYEPIHFPGAILDIERYIAFHEINRNELRSLNQDTCESAGIVFRLKKIHSNLLFEISEFLQSSAFVDELAQRFGVDADKTIYDGGFQKYLDGYEISPHPDIRSKAVTLMINLSPSDSSENNMHHTELMKLKRGYEYIENFWSHNPNYERCWLPWDWCEPVTMHKLNNSALLFSPSENTFHAVRAKYDHLGYQRTQFYANLWMKNSPMLNKRTWEDFI